MSAVIDKVLPHPVKYHQVLITIRYYFLASAKYPQATKTHHVHSIQLFSQHQYFLYC